MRSPGIYTLAGHKRLIDLLTEAGGTTTAAGHVIEIFAPGSMKNPTTVLWDPTLRENDNAELEIKTGEETILVSRCGVVYVGGNVGRPGAFPLCESNHTTISEVIALAQGTKANSYSNKTLLLRTSGNGTRVVQTVKLEDVLRGKKVDITMQPDDILFIPPSILKAAGKTALSRSDRIRHAGVFLRALKRSATTVVWQGVARSGFLERKPRQDLPLGSTPVAKLLNAQICNKNPWSRIANEVQCCHRFI